MENQSNNHKNSGNQNNRRPDNRGRPYNRKSHGGQDRRTSISRIGSSEKKRSHMGGQAVSVKAKDQQKGRDRAASDNPCRERADQRNLQQNRFSRNNNRFNRSIRAKREETVEDIRNDVEQLEKDIQFEIKQIRSIKLGL